MWYVADVRDFDNIVVDSFLISCLDELILRMNWKTKLSHNSIGK